MAPAPALGGFDFCGRTRKGSAGGDIMIVRRTFVIAGGAALAASAAWAGEDAEAQLTAMADASYTDPQYRAAGLTYVDTAKKAQARADKGEAEGINDLGVCYILGEGVDKDLPRGVALLEKAFAAGSSDAEFNLAELYRTGIGVEKDEAKAAAMYLAIVAKGGSGTQLAFMYCRGEGVSQSFANAAALFAGGADKGGIYDGYEAGLCAAIGRGAPKNPELAVFFLLVAVRIRRYPEAEKALSLVKYLGSGAEWVAGVKRFQAWRAARAPLP